MGFILDLASHPIYSARHRRPRWSDNDAVIVIALGLLLWAAIACGLVIR